MGKGDGDLGVIAEEYQMCLVLHTFQVKGDGMVSFGDNPTVGIINELE
jgi:hypothetical protein